MKLDGCLSSSYGYRYQSLSQIIISMISSIKENREGQCERRANSEMSTDPLHHSASVDKVKDQKESNE